MTRSCRQSCTLWFQKTGRKEGSRVFISHLLESARLSASQVESRVEEAAAGPPWTSEELITRRVIGRIKRRIKRYWQDMREAAESESESENQTHTANLEL